MTSQKKEDPRAVRSKKMFKEALLELLVENPSLSQLTVQKIARRAELNRATFYLHYEDITDLLRQMTNELMEELSDKLDVLVHADFIENEDYLIRFLDYIYENRKYLGVLFEQTNFEQKLFALLADRIQSRRARKQKILRPNQVANEIYAASLMGVIKWWLTDGNEYSTEYMAKQIRLIHKR